MRIASLYALLAAIATIANIATQDVFLHAYRGPLHIAISIMLGTAAGLLVKYILDKRFIFHFKADDVAHDSRTFALYAAMGIATTAIFWGFEFSFNAWFDESTPWRYLGGILGLAIGYATKYQLDKRYVFRK